MFSIFLQCINFFSKTLMFLTLFIFLSPFATHYIVFFFHNKACSICKYSYSYAFIIYIFNFSIFLFIYVFICIEYYCISYIHNSSYIYYSCNIIIKHFPLKRNASLDFQRLLARLKIVVDF